MSEYTLPFMQGASTSAPAPAMYTSNGSQSFGHPLSSARWFTGDTSVPGFTPLNSQAPQAPTIFPGMNGMPGSQPNAAPQGWWDKMGGMEGLNQGVSAFSNLAGIYAGFKSLGLAKDQFKFAKSSFNKNFDASAQAYNNQLEERWEQKKNIYESRGREYEGMESWLADKTIDKTSKRDKDNKGKG